MGTLLVSERLIELNKWIDSTNKNRDPEAATWSRLAKIGEEYGETVAAYIGVTGQNVRKGVTHSVDDVAHELLDTAVTALLALEHLSSNRGDSLQMMFQHIIELHKRMETAYRWNPGWPMTETEITPKTVHSFVY